MVIYKTSESAHDAVSQLADAQLKDTPISVVLSKKGAGNRTKSRSARARRRRGSGTSRRPRLDDGEEGSAEAADDATGAPRTTKQRAPKKPKKVREPSKTLLFVSHLAYSVKDEDLLEFFSDYAAVSANVVYHRQNPNHSRGFAFVDFPNEAAQLKALDETHGKELQGRAISVSGTCTLLTQSPCSPRSARPSPTRLWRNRTKRATPLNLFLRNAVEPSHRPSASPRVCT